MSLDFLNITLVDGLVAAIVSAVVSLFVSLRQNYVTAVTTQRSIWINSLRENISELLSTLSAIRSIDEEDRKKAFDKYERADKLLALIEMQLNPNGEIDRNMIELLPILIKCAEKEEDGYRTLERQFVRHSQYLLKEEWEKVKSEASLLPFLRWGGNCQRKCEYEKFSIVSKKITDTFVK